MIVNLMKLNLFLFVSIYLTYFLLFFSSLSCDLFAYILHTCNHCSRRLANLLTVGSGYCFLSNLPYLILSSYSYRQRMFARLASQVSFFPVICTWDRVRSAGFSDGGMRDRDIIFRDQMYLVFCFLGCVVKFPAREVNSWWRSAFPKPGNWMSEFVFFFRLSTFFPRAKAHTRTNRQVRRDSERR